MNPKRRSSTALLLMSIIAGESVDSIIDQVLDPRCTKCGHKVESVNDLFTVNHICAPCVMGVEWKEETP